MTVSLNTIISEIKQAALNNGFKSVQELKLNMQSNSDTLLPKLFIRMDGYNFDKFMIDTAEETYKLELIIVNKCTDNPLSNLKLLSDKLLNKMFTNNLSLSKLAQNNKVSLLDSNLTNDRDLYSSMGGEGVTIRLEIKNINTFGGPPC